MSPISGEQVIATILKHDNKTTSYKIALLWAINDLVLLYPDLARADQPVAVSLCPTGHYRLSGLYFVQQPDSRD